MPKSLVVDASFAIRLILPDPRRSALCAQMERWLQEGYELLAPDLWLYEMITALCKGAFFGLITAEEAENSLPLVSELAIQLVAADAEQLAFAPNSFDVILALEILEHLWNPHDFLDEAYRVLKANGHLIIEVPEGREGLRWDSHMQYFTLEGLKKMPGSRFTVREIKRLKPVVGVPTPTIILLLRKSVVNSNTLF